MKESFKVTKKRGLLMAIALIPSVLLLVVLIKFIDVYFVNSDNARILFGVIIFCIFVPIGGWYGGKKWDILIKRFQKEDEEIK